MGLRPRLPVHVWMRILFQTANRKSVVGSLADCTRRELGRAVGGDFVTRRAFTWIHVHHPTSCTVTAQLQLHAFRDFGQVGPESRSAGSSWTPPRPSSITCKK